MATAKGGGDQYSYGNTIASPVGIISFPKVWEAVTNDLSNKRQFQCSILIPKQGAEIKEVVGESMKVAQALFGDRYKTLTAFGERNCPIKDGDTKQAGDPAIGHWIFPASCGEDRRPFVVDKNNRPIGDHSEIYGGAIGLIWLQPMAYSTKFGNGVKFMLKGVQKIADGKPFGAAAFDPAAAGFKAPEVPAYLRGHVETRHPALGVAMPQSGNGRTMPFTQADADRAAVAAFNATSLNAVQETGEADDSIPF
jgi:hypothetical protein